ncbi:MAG: hypothetical protein JNN22_12510 [Rhodospirillales bacterium]|nr:hypothetical protein [Rhodospirillales bacterium]
MRVSPTLLFRRARRLSALELAVVAFTFVVVSGIWGAVMWRLETDRARAYAQAETELLGAQGLLSAHVGRTVESAKNHVDSVDRWLVDQNAYSDIGSLSGLVDNLQRHYSFPLSVRLFDLNGDSISYGNYGTTGINVSDREYIRALDDRPVEFIHIGRQVVTRSDGIAAIPLAKRAQPNVFGIGYVVTFIPLGPLNELFANIFVTAPGIIGIVRDDGYILYRNPPQGYVDAKVDLNYFSTSPGHPRDSGIIRGRNDLAGRPLVIAFRRVERSPLFVYAHFTADDVEAQIAAGRPLIYGIAAVATLLALAMAGLVGWYTEQGAREAERLRAALTEAEAANTAKREFLANVSHELRTPLNAIIGFSEFIVLQVYGPIHERYRTYVGDVLTAGRHLLGVVNQLLDIAAIEARRLELRIEPVDPAAIIRDVVEMMRPMAEARGVRIVESPPRIPLSATCDTGALRQILVNLVGNATKFCNANGVVSIAWERTSAAAYRIAISDEGDGIPEEDIAHIFEPFWRKESAHVTRAGGTGLGLSLTRQLVWHLGGTIRVESVMGKGSVFEISLPSEIVQGFRTAA